MAPSGAALARLITQEVSSKTGPVIELGPGTGVFTAQLHERGVPPEKLTLIEFTPEFAERLKARFPSVRVLTMDAARLAILERTEQAGAVISGLPLLSMPPRKVMAILSGAFSHLRPGGAFFQFTYGPRCPVPKAILERLHLRATKVGGSMLNIPPAAVYRIGQRRLYSGGSLAV